MKKLSDYNEYDGVDASLDIALYEYGLIWKEINPGEYHFIYGVGHDGCEYNSFDWADMTDKDWNELLNESWVDIEGVESFSGQTKQDLIDSFPYNVDTLLAYYGYENIFGSAYYPFEIENDEV